jgi:hypothetical protein
MRSRNGAAGRTSSCASSSLANPIKTPTSGASIKTYREEVLSAYLFDSLDKVGEITNDSLDQYDEIGPHDALGGMLQCCKAWLEGRESSTPILYS